MNQSKKVWKQWLYCFVFAVAVIVVYKILDNYTYIKGWLDNLFEVIMPFSIGILIAYLLYLPCRKIERIYEKARLKFLKKRARVCSIITVYIILSILIIIAINFLVPVIAQSLIDFINNFQNYYNVAMEKIQNLPDNPIINQQFIQEIIQNVQEINLKQYFNMERLTQYAKGVADAASSVVNIFVTIIVSIYVLMERRHIVEFIKKIIFAMFDFKVAQKIKNYFNRTNEIFFKFLASQVLDAIVVGILTSIAMSILGVKYAVLLGFFIGLSNLIPYFGAIIGVAISSIITIFTGGLPKAIWMLIIVIILQQIDANIINPKIVGNSLKMSPLLVIFAVTIGGAYFGMLGMFLAVPIFAVLKVVIIDYVEYKNRKKQVSMEEEA